MRMSEASEIFPMISTLSAPKKRSRRPKVGAPVGNTNASKDETEKQTSILHLRCHGDDKGEWTDAANLAVAKGTLKPDARGNLASWVIRTLNTTAARELAPKGRH